MKGPYSIVGAQSANDHVYQHGPGDETRAIPRIREQNRHMLPDLARGRTELHGLDPSLPLEEEVGSVRRGEEALRGGDRVDGRGGE
jgi:hypothetical protein